MSNKPKNKGKKQEKDTVLLDNLEKFAVENRDIPKLQQIISDYLQKNEALKTSFYEKKQKKHLIQLENVVFFP